MTHDDTLVTIIASRLGRDLSGILREYERLYKEPLPSALSAQTRGDLKALLVGIVSGVPPHPGDAVQS